MKTFVLNIIPKIQKYSKKLDNISLLTGQHWVVIDEIIENKSVYIFRSDKELLISQKGIVTKANWDYVGNKSLLIDIGDNSYLFNHGFLDENVLALKLDGIDEFVILLNESKFNKELNSVQKIEKFLTSKYLDKELAKTIHTRTSIHVGDKKETIHTSNKVWKQYQTSKGILEVEIFPRNKYPWEGDFVKLNSMPAQDGKYKIGFMFYVKVKKGQVERITWI